MKKIKNINHFIGCPFPSTLFVMTVIHLMMNIKSRQFCINTLQEFTDFSDRNFQGIHWTSY